MKGQYAQPKDEVMNLISQIDTRAKTISLLILIAACRPSEMITIKVKHIDLTGRSIKVYMQKQNEWRVKKLTLECVHAVKAYIKEYGLEADHYIVVQLDKHGNYKSSCISDTVYRKAIHKRLGFALYTLIKTQVIAIHEAGADIATIAK